jgi:hypothetical protein
MYFSGFSMIKQSITALISDTTRTNHRSIPISTMTGGIPAAETYKKNQQLVYGLEL